MLQIKNFSSRRLWLLCHQFLQEVPSQTNLLRFRGLLLHTRPRMSITWHKYHQQLTHLPNPSQQPEVTCQNSRHLQGFCTKSKLLLDHFYTIERQVHFMMVRSFVLTSKKKLFKGAKFILWTMPITAVLVLIHTLGARDFSSAVSGFCQVFIVTRAREKPLVPRVPYSLLRLKKWLMNEKNHSFVSNMSPRHYVKRFKQQKWTLKNC